MFFFLILVQPAPTVLFAIFQLSVTPKKAYKDRLDPQAIVVSDGMVRKMSLIWYKGYVNKLFHQLRSVWWLITVSIATTLYQLLTMADKL